MTTTLTKSVRAILRAVRAGTAELGDGPHPDLVFDRRFCIDHMAAVRRFVAPGLIIAFRAAELPRPRPSSVRAARP
jgi:hypothetical protein